MTPRERVLMAIDHRETDRVPIVIGGSAAKFYESTILKLMDLYRIPRENMTPVITGFKYAPYCEKLLEEFGVDIRYLYPDSHGDKLLGAQKNAAIFTTKWGGKIAFTDSDGERPNLELEAPLANATIDDIERHPWPEPGKDLILGLKERALKLKEEGKYAIGVYRPFTSGIFGTARYFLRGSVKFFEDMLLEKNFADVLLERILEVQKEYYKAILDEVGSYIDIIEIEDDMGMQQAPLVSPGMYREMLKPKHAELVSYIKGMAPRVKVMIHSDGAISELIADFIETGIDILNPIQVNARGMGLKELKKKFGKNITFAGGVDVQKPMMGSVADIIKCTRSTIDIMGKSGGYLLGPTHNFSPDIPINNIIAMFDTAKNYYPFK